MGKRGDPHMILRDGARPGNQQARRGATRPLSISRPCVRSDVRRLTTKDRKSHKGTRIAAVRTAARRLMSPHSFPLVRMAGFPPNNSLYSPDQAYRLSDAEPFGERSLVVASDDQWRYAPVRRLALFVETSISSSLQSAAFEPNGPALWTRVNSEVTEFLSGLFRRGELKGDRASQAYFVRCGVDTMTESDVENGDLNIVVGFAPLKPAEFVIVAIAAMAGPPAPNLPPMPRDPPWRWIWARWDE